MSEPDATNDIETRQVTFRLALVSVAAAAAVFGFTIFVIATQFKYWEAVLRDHFAAIIGLSAAGTLAFALVPRHRGFDSLAASG